MIRFETAEGRKDVTLGEIEKTITVSKLLHEKEIQITETDGLSELFEAISILNALGCKTELDENSQSIRVKCWERTANNKRQD